MLLFTSMFVERMEVLEYHKKFEVALIVSTNPDSTNTETSRALVFRLTCVHVCAIKFVSGYLNDILGTSRPIWMKISVYVAIGLESRTTPNKHSRTNISPKFGKGGDFCKSLNPYISKTNNDIKKQRRPSRCTILRSTNLILYVFAISNGFWDILKKMFIQKVCQRQGFKNTSWYV